MATNGGMLYHEVQESNLCAVHCLNTLLQGPYFDETDLAAMADDLDREERRVMNREFSEVFSDFLAQDSHNVSTAGDFSIQVLQRALSVWNLKVIPVNSNVDHDPERENAFICHSHGHWFCIRYVNGDWYNFNSLYAAPEHLSEFYLCAFLDTLKSSGWSVFLVRGDLPVECSLTTSPNSFGQWLTPEGAKIITYAIRESQDSQQIQDPDPLSWYSQKTMDDQHLHAAAVADSLGSATEEIQTKGASPGFSAFGSESYVMQTEAASIADTSPALHAAAVADSSTDSSRLESATEEIQTKGASPGFSAVGSESDVMQTEAASMMMDTSPTLDAAAVSESSIDSLGLESATEEIQTENAVGPQSDVTKTEAAIVSDTSPTLDADAVAESSIYSLGLESATEEIQTENAVGPQSDVTKTEAASVSDTSPTPGSGLVTEGPPTTESSRLEGPLADGDATTDYEDVVPSDAELDQELASFFVWAREANKTSDDGVSVEALASDSDGSVERADMEFTEAARSDTELFADLLCGLSSTGGRSSSAGF